MDKRTELISKDEIIEYLKAGLTVEELYFEENKNEIDLALMCIGRETALEALLDYVNDLPIEGVKVEMKLGE